MKLFEVKTNNTLKSPTSLHAQGTWMIAGKRNSFFVLPRKGVCVTEDCRLPIVPSPGTWLLRVHHCACRWIRCENRGMIKHKRGTTEKLQR